MPEGPEVRRSHEDVMRVLKGRAITGLVILGGRFEKKAPVGYAEVQLPTTIVDGGVKGKFMWFELGDHDTTMWVTLGMSGYWSSYQTPHAHFRIDFMDSNNELNAVYFIDQRRFGTIKFSHNKTELAKKLKSLGLDLLNEEPEIEEFIEIISKKPERSVCEVLMDQRVCSGVGNYIKCEVLYRSRISPYRKVKDLSRSEFGKLYSWTKKIIKASYLQGGASIRNYRRLTGEIGDFVFEFEVYAQKQDPHGNPVVREETLDKRTTHWVPSLQL